MSVALRILLILVSVWNCGWVLRNIRKSQIKIESSVFWILFSVFLIILSAFPEIAYYGSEIIGVQSPANFIFLAVIFILMVKLFRQTAELSRLEVKLNKMIQEYALDRCQRSEEE